MVAHSNRNRLSASANPTAAEVRAAREAAGLTQTQAATLIHGTLRAWQEWEAGNRRMHPGLFELFQIKVGARELDRIAEQEAAVPYPYPDD